MRLSAHITPEDHQEFLNALAGSGWRKLSAGLASFRVIIVSVLLLASVVIFPIVLARTTHSEGFGIFLAEPVRLILVVAGLACVGIAVPILWKTAPLLRVLRFASARTINTASLRKGVNLGEAHYDIGDGGLRVSLDLVQETYPWGAFNNLVETDKLICLMLGKDKGLMVPKRAFGDDAGLSAFKDLIGSRGERKYEGRGHGTDF